MAMPERPPSPEPGLSPRTGLPGKHDPSSAYHIRHRPQQSPRASDQAKPSPRDALASPRKPRAPPRPDPCVGSVKKSIRCLREETAAHEAREALLRKKTVRRNDEKCRADRLQAQSRNEAAALVASVVVARSDAKARRQEELRACAAKQQSDARARLARRQADEATKRRELEAMRAQHCVARQRALQVQLQAAECVASCVAPNPSATVGTVHQRALRATSNAEFSKARRAMHVPPVPLREAARGSTPRSPR